MKIYRCNIKKKQEAVKAALAGSGSRDHFPYQRTIFIIMQILRFIAQLLSINLYGGKSKPYDVYQLLHQYHKIWALCNILWY